MKPEKTMKYCKNCGEFFMQKTAGAPKIYCSPKCRRKYREELRAMKFAANIDQNVKDIMDSITVPHKETEREAHIFERRREIEEKYKDAQKVKDVNINLSDFVKEERSYHVLSVRISDYQKNFLEKKNVNTSALIRAFIDGLIEDETNKI